MKPQIPWLRVFVEGVLIVGSILLAFGIEAWWDERQERAEEIKILGGLDEEFVAYRSTLERVLARHEVMLGGVEQLLDASQRGRWNPTDGQAEQALLDLVLPPTIDLGRGVRDALISSGRLESLSDPDLRIKLASWEGVFDEVVDNELRISAIRLRPDHPILGASRDSAKSGA